MKTKSMKSFAALLGVASILSTASFAGPGPQPEPQTFKSSDKNVAALQLRQRSSTGKSVKKPSPLLVQITGPHGSTFAYVR